VTFTFRERQLAFAICCGMPDSVIAEALGIGPYRVRISIAELLEKTGMANRVEFATQQNAAVRELLYPDPEITRAA
jgi:DNA-binding NarL/FixJ family response regulator